MSEIKRQDISKFRGWVKNQPQVKDIKFLYLPEADKKALMEKLYQEWKNQRKA